MRNLSEDATMFPTRQRIVVLPLSGHVIRTKADRLFNTDTGR
jgi:hypothetical protein